MTLVELEGLTAREPAALVGISISGMKSRVQRGRDRVCRMLEECCEIVLDAGGKVIEFTPGRRARIRRVARRDVGVSMEASTHGWSVVSRAATNTQSSI
jgi:hypothetical protein